MFRNLFSFLLKAKISSFYVQSRVQFWVVVVIFAGLGFQVGVWTILLADLAHALKLSPALLGIALSCFSCSGIVFLVLGSYLADRLTRRFIALLGLCGLSLFYLSLIFVTTYPLLLKALFFGGTAASCYDLAANTLGGDYERRYTKKVMTLFHASFSGGAALGAISSAIALANTIDYRTIYGATALLLVVLGSAMIFLPLPPTIIQATTTKEVELHRQPTSLLAVLVLPTVLLAVALVSLSFFTDGALEGYTSIYLRDLLGSGVLLGGIAIAIFHVTGLVGRLLSTVALRCYGERRVITVAATLSAIGMILALSTTQSSLAVSGLLLVGLGQSPIVATAFSLAAEAGPQQGARAVAIVTAFGYSIFLISPLLIGILATLFSLRVALLLTIVTSVGIVLVAQRLPRKHA